MQVKVPAKQFNNGFVIKQLRKKWIFLNLRFIEFNLEVLDFVMVVMMIYTDVIISCNATISFVLQNYETIKNTTSRMQHIMP